MSFKKILAGGIVVLGTGAMFITPAYAADTTTIKDNAIENRCTKVTNNIQSKIATFNANRDRHIETYQNIKNRVEALVTKMDAKGYDTTKLKSDLATVDSMIKDFGTTYQGFINDLTNTQNFACGDSQGQFIQALANAKGDLSNSRQKASDIRDFIKNTIKVDLQNIRDQAKKESN